MSEHHPHCVSEWHPVRDDCTCGAVLNTLAANIAIGAALCRAYYAAIYCAENVDVDGRPWWPGCRRLSL